MGSTSETHYKWEIENGVHDGRNKKTRLNQNRRSTKMEFRELNNDCMVFQLYATNNRKNVYVFTDNKGCVGGYQGNLFR